MNAEIFRGEVSRHFNLLLSGSAKTSFKLIIHTHKHAHLCYIYTETNTEKMLTAMQ